MTPADTLTIDGITQPISEWALDYGIYPAVIVERLEDGWTAHRAVTQPMLVTRCQKLDADHMPGLPRVKRKQTVYKHLYEFDGEALTIVQWCARVGINVHTLRLRLAKGMEIGEALTLPVRKPTPGVGKNFGTSMGTGGGSVAQVTS